MNLRILILALLLSGPGLSFGRFDAAAWLGDYDQLKQVVADVYPNLEWVVKAHKLNLKHLDKITLDSLKAAKSHDQAFDILNQFVESFGDPHFRLVGSKQNDNRPRKNDFLYPLPDDFAEQKKGNISFRFGVVERKGKKIGLVRVHSFREEDYFDFTVKRWDPVHVQNRLLGEFSRTLSSLNGQNIRALVVDITGNGGGSGWVEGVMAMLTAKKLKCGAWGYIRHPHWAEQFKAEKAELSKKLAAAPKKKKQRFKNEIAALDKKIEAVNTKCDRSAIWSEENPKFKCDLVIKEPTSNCGSTREFPIKKGVYNGPLYFLVNGRTSSASEDLAARFKDSKLATIIGEKTGGAGCGYTNGGINIKLKNTAIRVKVPDCVRYFLDGRNEVEGVLPDIQISAANQPSSDFLKLALDKVAERVSR